MRKFILRIINIFHFREKKIKPSITKKGPSTAVIKKGTLKNYSLFFNPEEVNDEINKILEGEYDQHLDEIHDWQNSSLIFDIGSHVGISTMYFDSLVSNQLTIVSIDPNPFALNRLKSNLELNKNLLKSKIEIINAAVAAETGTMEFDFCPDIDKAESTGGHLINSYTPFDESVYSKLGFIRKNVEVITFDDLVQKYGVPDFVKIDVEGAESFVLSGGFKTLNNSSNRLNVIVEIHSIEAMYQCLSFLRQIKRDVLINKINPKDWSTSRGFLSLFFV